MRAFACFCFSSNFEGTGFCFFGFSVFLIFFEEDHLFSDRLVLYAPLPSFHRLLDQDQAIIVEKELPEMLSVVLKE